MSNLETANAPLIGPPIDGKSISLDQLQRMSVAAWSVKTAMLDGFHNQVCSTVCSIPKMNDMH